MVWTRWSVNREQDGEWLCADGHRGVGEPQARGGRGGGRRRSWGRSGAARSLRVAGAAGVRHAGQRTWCSARGPRVCRQQRECAATRHCGREPHAGLERPEQRARVRAQRERLLAARLLASLLQDIQSALYYTATWHTSIVRVCNCTTVLVRYLEVRLLCGRRRGHLAARVHHRRPRRRRELPAEGPLLADGSMRALRRGIIGAAQLRQEPALVAHARHRPAHTHLRASALAVLRGARVRPVTRLTHCRLCGLRAGAIGVSIAQATATGVQEQVRPWVALLTVSVLPALCIALLNAHILAVLSRTRSRMSHLQPRASREASTQRVEHRALLLALVMSVSFFVFTTPYFAFRVLEHTLFSGLTKEQVDLLKRVFLAFLDCQHMADFYLYVAFSSSFRQKLLQALRGVASASSLTSKWFCSGSVHAALDRSHRIPSTPLQARRGLTNNKSSRSSLRTTLTSVSYTPKNDEYSSKFRLAFEKLDNYAEFHVHYGHGIVSDHQASIHHKLFTNTVHWMCLFYVCVFVGYLVLSCTCTVFAQLIRLIYQFLFFQNT